MREEFLEPMPVIQTTATLLLGETRTPCFIVDLTVDEFRVAVPGASGYEGDPRVTLITREAIFPVRIVLQEAHAGGYSFRLQRVYDVAPLLESRSRYFRAGFSILSCCAVGLIAVVATSFCLIPTTSEKYPLLSLRGLRKEGFGWFSPSVKENDQSPPGISNVNSLVVGDSKKREQHALTPQEPVSELQTVSVSMISPASMSTSSPALLPADEASTVNQGGNGRHPHGGKSPNKQSPSFVSLLEEGLVGRLQAASPDLVPWLYETKNRNPYKMLQISDAALLDLQQFENGLRGLPNDVCVEAMGSLRQALLQANQVKNAKAVRELRGVFVIASADANIYFRSKSGTIELVRVLPIDTNGAE